MVTFDLLLKVKKSGLHQKIVRVCLSLLIFKTHVKPLDLLRRTSIFRFHLLKILIEIEFKGNGS